MTNQFKTVNLDNQYTAEKALPSLALALNAAGHHALSLAIWSECTVVPKLTAKVLILSKTRLGNLYTKNRLKDSFFFPSYIPANLDRFLWTGYFRAVFRTGRGNLVIIQKIEYLIGFKAGRVRFFLQENMPKSMFPVFLTCSISLSEIWP